MRISDWSSDVCSSDLQSPTTVTLPLERRMALLERAQRGDFLIVEDDYEAEANFMHAPTTALKAMDRSGRVIYVGSFSKYLGPGLRMGYMVGAAEFIHEARMLRRLMLRHPATNNQSTLALRSEEHTSALQSPMRISNAVCCLKK